MIFHKKLGLSATIRPYEFMTEKNDYDSHLKLWFGCYIQAHEKNDPMNSINSSNTGALSVGTSSNLQGE